MQFKSVLVFATSLTSIAAYGGSQLYARDFNELDLLKRDIFQEGYEAGLQAREASYYSDDDYSRYASNLNLKVIYSNI